MIGGRSVDEHFKGKKCFFWCTWLRGRDVVAKRSLLCGVKACWVSVVCPAGTSTMRLVSGFRGYKRPYTLLPNQFRLYLSDIITTSTAYTEHDCCIITTPMASAANWIALTRDRPITYTCYMHHQPPQSRGFFCRGSILLCLLAVTGELTVPLTRTKHVYFQYCFFVVRKQVKTLL